jgi:hypothetical protein
MTCAHHVWEQLLLLNLTSILSTQMHEKWTIFLVEKLVANEISQLESSTIVLV